MTRLICAILVIAMCTLVLADEPKAIELFNGKDLAGWKQAGPGSFEVKDGELHTSGGMGLLWYTPRQFADYSLTFEFKTSKLSDNSGVFLRFPDPAGDPWAAVKHGEEVQIQDGGKNLFTGGIYNVKNATELASKPPGEWNVMEITVTGAKIAVKVNGKLVNEYTSPKPMPAEGGYIGLQNHDPDSMVSFRKVKLIELPKRPQ